VSVAAYAAADLCSRDWKNAVKPDGSGQACHFYRLTDEIGLKTYTRINVAKAAYTVQKYFAKVGLSPDCWGYSEHGNYAAFFTEIVTPITTGLTIKGGL